MNPLCGAIPVLCAHAGYSLLSIVMPSSLGNDLADPAFDVVRLAGYEGRADNFLLV